MDTSSNRRVKQFWCSHLGGLGPPFPYCKVCQKEADTAILFVDGFDHFSPEEVASQFKRDLAPRSGSVYADLPTMRWIGTGPVTFYLTENPAGPQYPASVEVVLKFESLGGLNDR